VIVLDVADYFIEVELDEEEWAPILGRLGLQMMGVCKVCVSVLRSPIDREVLHAKSSSTLRDVASQGELELHG